jgi:hypothetical protein
MDRQREIDRRVNERYLSTSGDRWANLHDPLHQQSVQQARQLLVATDKAMAAEGVGAEVRDRVMCRVLYGESPDGCELPDWTAAARRAADRELEAHRLATTSRTAVALPPDLAKLIGEVSG